MKRLYRSLKWEVIETSPTTILVSRHTEGLRWDSVDKRNLPADAPKKLRAVVEEWLAKAL